MWTIQHLFHRVNPLPSRERRFYESSNYAEKDTPDLLPLDGRRIKRGGDTTSKSRKVALARSFRKKPTDAEYKLWGYLRGKQLGGLKFRRQAPISDHIVDFVCYSKRVVVEVDGESHTLRREEDKIRDRKLESEGLKVVRFWNSEVFEDVDGVLNVIWKECGGESGE